MDGKKRLSDEAIPLTGHARLGILISSGIHDGTRLDALALPVTIGSDLTCDVVLRDDGIMPRHLYLYSDRGNVFAAALQGTVDIDGRGRLQPGHGARIELPSSLLIGNTRLQLLARNRRMRSRSLWTSWPSRAWRGKRKLTLTLAVVAVLVAGPAVFAGFSPAPDRRLMALSSPDQVQDPIDHAEVEQFLRHALAAQQLDSLSIDRQQAAWIVSGDLDRSEYERWLDVRRTAEARFGSGLVIESKVNRNGITPPRIAIAAIRLGEHPYIVDEHGKRHAPGAALADGWVLARLDDQALVLRHGTTEHTLNY